MRTAESVAVGHPDKVCDQISDAILDACLEQDPMTRAAIEVMGGHGIITITGELTTKASLWVLYRARGNDAADKDAWKVFYRRQCQVFKTRLLEEVHKLEDK